MITNTSVTVLLLKLTLIGVVLAITTVARGQPISLDQGRWQKLKYTNIQQNRTRLRDGTIRIEVDGSASPLIYPFSAPERATSLDIVARIDGQLDLDPQLQQGDRGNDDFRLWIGVAYAGDNSLGFLQRLMAPDWIRHLFEMAPDGAGISRIEFYTTYSDSKLAGTSRIHPAIELCEQQFVLRVDDNGRIDQRINLALDQPVVALWVNSDGDDSSSSFTVEIETLRLNR